jgi:hypothetical protein
MEDKTRINTTKNTEKVDELTADLDSLTKSFKKKLPKDLHHYFGEKTEYLNILSAFFGDNEPQEDSSNISDAPSSDKDRPE